MLGVPPNVVAVERLRSGVSVSSPDQVAVRWSPRLGAHLEAARVQAGLRRVDLANRLGVSEEAVRLWERGTVQPSEEHLTRLIPYLSTEAVSWSAPADRHDEEEAPPLARRLRDERARRGLTQAAMAAVIGAPQATYAGWETGRSTPSAPYLDVLAELLGVDIRAVEALCANPFTVDVSGWPPLGQLIGRRREALRLTRAALAAELDVSPRTVANWELGNRRPRPEQVIRLSSVLEVPPETLLAALPALTARSRFGEVVLSRCRELGLQAADLARLIGTTEPTLSRWVNGHSRPMTRNLERLADVLRVPHRTLEAALSETA